MKIFKNTQQPRGEKHSTHKLAIMNTTNETEQVQSLGRLRHDIDILVYRVSKKENPDFYINLSNEYIDRELTAPEKDELVEKLNIRDDKGRLRKWHTVKNILIKQGYKIIDTYKTINGKRVRVSKITI